MTRLNPIIKRDIELKSRGVTLPVVIIIFNALLFFVGIAGCFGIMSSVRQNYMLNYGEFLRVYIYVVVLAAFLLLFTAPLLTAAGISGEKERGTFELLLTTRLTSTDIVLEKLASAMLTMTMLAVSCFPALLTPLIFGGVQIQSAAFLLLVILLECFVILAVGLFASCIGSSSVKSIAIAYAITAGLIAGPVLLALLFRSFSPEGTNSMVYLFVIDPLLPILSVLLDQIGEGNQMSVLFRLFHGPADYGFFRNAAFIGLIIQLALAAGFVVMAVVSLLPRSGKIREIRNQDEASL